MGQLPPASARTPSASATAWPRARCAASRCTQGPIELDGRRLLLLDHPRRQPESQRAQAELQRTISLLQSTLDSTTDGIPCHRPPGTHPLLQPALRPDVADPARGAGNRGDDDEEAMAFAGEQLHAPEQFRRKIQQVLRPAGRGELRRPGVQGRPGLRALLSIPPDARRAAGRPRLELPRRHRTPPGGSRARAESGGQLPPALRQPPHADVGSTTCATSASSRSTSRPWSIAGHSRDRAAGHRAVADLAPEATVRPIPPPPTMAPEHSGNRSTAARTAAPDPTCTWSRATSASSPGAGPPSCGPGTSRRGSARWKPCAWAGRSARAIPEGMDEGCYEVDLADEPHLLQRRALPLARLLARRSSTGIEPAPRSIGRREHARGAGTGCSAACARPAARSSNAGAPGRSCAKGGVPRATCRAVGVPHAAMPRALPGLPRRGHRRQRETPGRGGAARERGALPPPRRAVAATASPSTARASSCSRNPAGSADARRTRWTRSWASSAHRASSIPRVPPVRAASDLDAEHPVGKAVPFIEEKFVRRDGTLVARWRAGSTPFTFTRTARRARSIIRDITERKRAGEAADARSTGSPRPAPRGRRTWPAFYAQRPPGRRRAACTAPQLLHWRSTTTARRAR